MMHAVRSRTVVLLVALSLFLAMVVPMACSSAAYAASATTDCSKTTGTTKVIQAHMTCTFTARSSEAVNLNLERPALHEAACAQSASPTLDARTAIMTGLPPSPSGGPSLATIPLRI